MYRPDYFPSNANAAPHMVLEELANSLREEPMIWQHPDRLLDVVTALPSGLRAASGIKLMARVLLIEDDGETAETIAAEHTHTLISEPARSG
jgi:hypothetical protein